MKFFPFENIIYRTRLEPDEIQQRLNDIIEPKESFRLRGIFGSIDHLPYEGIVFGNSFNIIRIIGYLNSNFFLPRISGVIEKEIDGSKIQVKMRLHHFVMVFMIIWLGGVGIGAIVATSKLFDHVTFEPIAFAFGMILLVLIMVIGGFKYESIKSKEYLAQLFEAEMEE